VDATGESENFLGDGFRCFGTVPELAQIPILGHERNFGASSGVGVMLLLGEEFFKGGESVGAESRFVVVGGCGGLSESSDRVRVQLELVRHCSNLVWGGRVGEEIGRDLNTGCYIIGFGFQIFGSKPNQQEPKVL